MDSYQTTAPAVSDAGWFGNLLGLAQGVAGVASAFKNNDGGEGQNNQAAAQAQAQAAADSKVKNWLLIGGAVLLGVLGLFLVFRSKK